MSAHLKHKRKLYITFSVVLSGVLLISFQNCSRTNFQMENIDSGSLSIGGSQDSSSSSGSCVEGAIPYSEISVSQSEVGEGHQILSYRLGEVTCGYTSFLVKVKAFGQFETYLAFRKIHQTGVNQLISKNAEGYPQFIYENGFSTSADGSSVIYVPQKIVDRAITYPEYVVRRKISSGEIQIVNANPNGELIPLPNSPQYLNQKVSESKDGSIVLFIAGGESFLFKKDLNTGVLENLGLTTDLSREATRPRVYSFSLSADGTKAVYHQTSSLQELININLSGSETQILTGNGTASHYDGVDEKVVKNSIISADGKYVYFMGRYEGGRRIQAPQVQIIKKDIQTGVSESVSTYSSTRGEQVVIEGADLQSVSADGRYVCFLARPSKLAAPLQVQFNNGQIGTAELVDEKIMAYVKDTQTGSIKIVSVLSNNHPVDGTVAGCSISSSAKTVSFEVRPFTQTNRIDADYEQSEAYDAAIRVVHKSIN